MKATMKDVFYHALLARAGYMLAENKKDGVTLEDVPKLLMESKQSKMTSAMADYLVSKFDFIKVADDDDVGVELEMPTIPIYPATPTLQPKINGYNGMIFQSKTDNNHYVLVNRGTEFDIDSLERFVSTLTDLWSDGNLAIEGDNEQSNSMKEFLEKAKKDGVIPEGATITTTGHSLGGFLSSMAIKDDELGISWAYGYNGAGYRPDANLLGKAAKALESIDEVKEIYEYYKNNTGKELPKLEQFFDDPRLGKAAKLLSRFKILVSAGYVGFNNLFDALGWKPLSIEGNMTNVMTEEGPDIVAGTGVKVGETRRITVDLPIDQTSGIASLNEHSIIPLTDAFVYAYLLDAIGNDSSLESFNRVVKAFSLMPGDKLTGLFEYLAKSFEYGGDLNETINKLRGDKQSKDSANSDVQEFLFNLIKDFEGTPSSNIRIYHLFNSDSNILIDNAFDKTDNGKLMRHALLNHSAISFNLKSTYGDKSKLSKIFGNDSYSYDKFVVNEKEYDKESEYEFFKNLVAMSQMVYENNMMKKHGVISHEGGIFPYHYGDSGKRLYINHWRDTEDLQNPYVMFENVDTQFSYERAGKNLNSYANSNYDVTFIGSHFGDTSTFVSNGDDRLYGLGGDDTLEGGEGNDYIDGGEGGDTLYGHNGEDILYGREGIDIIHGEDDTDTLIGGADADILYGGDGDDTLIGGISEDDPTDEDAENLLYGEAGNDTLKGSGYLSGGEDFDTYDAYDTATVEDDKDGKGTLSYHGQRLVGAVMEVKVKGELAPPSMLDFSKDNYDIKDKSTGRLKVISKTENSIKYVVDDNIDFVYKDKLTTKNLENTHLGIRFFVVVSKDDPKDPPPPPNNPPKNPPTLSDPLVLDLNHNGRIDTVHLSRGVNFDLDGNRFAEQTSWVSGTDGFVVLDINNNGRIDNGSELFGTDTLIQGTSNKASDGFVALAQHDGNQDGIIDNKDNIYHRLKIWQDKNQDGISQADELKALAEHGILDINLTKQSDNQVDDSQVTHTYQGSFNQTVTVSTVSEANPAETISTPVIKQGIAKTLLFQVNTSNTKWQVNDDEVGITDDIKALPNLIGYGTVKSLHHAISDDTTGQLRNLITQFNTATFENQSTIAEQILIHWTGQANTEKGESIEGRVNLRQLGVLKALWGKEQEWQNVGLNRFAVGALEGAYNNTLNNLHSQLLSQTHHKVLLSLVDFKINQHEYKGVVEKVYQADFDALIHQLLATYQKDVVYGKQLIQELNFTIRYLDINHSQLYNDWLQQFNMAIKEQNLDELATILMSESISTTNASYKGDSIQGTEQDDVIDSKEGNDIVYGLLGNDTLRGGMDNDILIGGVGNDHLEGGAGSDTYVFGLGDGKDIIINHDANLAKLDTIYFTSDVKPSAVSLKRDYSSLIVQYSPEDSVTIQYFFDKSGATDHRIDQIQFADGTIWTVNDILHKAQQSGTGDDKLYAYANQNTHLQGQEGNDTLYGENGDDILDGGADNDKLYGGKGDDVLIGGMGDDILEGNEGNNTYIFGLGDGQDSITTVSGNKYDTIAFRQDITPEMVVLKREDGKLIIQYVQNDTILSTDGITVSNFFDNNGLTSYHLDRLKFADGIVWTANDIKTKIAQGTNQNDTILGYDNEDDIIYGGMGDDRLFGKNGDDTLNGGEGHDWLYGEYGNDTLNGGEGHDWLYGEYGNDTLNGNEGNDLLEGGRGQDILSGGDGNDILRGNTQFYRNSFDVVSVISDDDDILNGGRGNDTLEGGEGDDIYVFEKDWGQDIVKEREGVNILYFKDINPENLAIYKYQKNLVIWQAKTENRVIITDYFMDYTTPNTRDNVIDILRFDGGVEWNAIDILSKLLQGNIDNDTLYGFDGDDHIIGNAGDDSLYGRKGDDILEGQDNNDTLYGNEGNDTLYGGDGDDVLDGGAGSNILDGGNGYDSYRVQHSVDTIIRDSDFKGNIFLDAKVTNAQYHHHHVWNNGHGSFASLVPDGKIISETQTGNTIKYTKQYTAQTSRVPEFIFNPAKGTFTLHKNGTSFNTNFSEYTDGFDYLKFDNIFNYDDINNLQEMDVTLSSIPKFTYSNAGALRYEYNFIETKLSMRDFINQGTVKAIYGDNDDVIEGISEHNNYWSFYAYDANENSISPYQLLGFDNHKKSNGDFYDDVNPDLFTGIITGDVVFAGAGNDKINTGKGASVIFAGSGDDYIVAPDTAGIDKVYGQTGNDTIYLYDPTGVIVSEKSKYPYIHTDEVYGGEGDDKIYGNEYVINGKIFGNEGDDHIELKGFMATVSGDDGDDTIILEKGATNISAGKGNDRVYVKSVEQPINTSLDAGEGDDVIEIQGHLQDVRGGDGNDTITVETGKIYGEMGDDVIKINNGIAKGGDGNDTIIAKNGNVTLDGGEGADHLVGGLGNDIYITDEFDTYLEEGKDLEGGYDTIHIASDFDLSVNNFEAVTLLGDGNFNVIGDEFDNIITGNIGNNHLMGGAGNDTIHGNAGDDMIYGNEGNDTLDGGDGDDYLDGGQGIDTLTSGLGNDYYILDNEFDTVIENADEGIDTLEQHTDRPFYNFDEFGNPIQTGSYHLLFDNVENLILKGTTKTAFGNYLDNTITLNEQSNFVNALSGNDTIIYQKGGGRDTILSADSLESKDSLVIEGYDLSEASFVRVTNTASTHDMLQIRFKGSNDQITLIDYFANEMDGQDNRIDQISFKKGGVVTALSQSEFEAKILAQGQNTAPKVNKYPKPVTAHIGKELLVQFDKDTIKDADPYDSELSYRITLATKDSGGQYQPIPEWLSFDPVTLTLKGTPPEGAKGNLQFILWGEDSFNYSAGAYVSLNVVNAPDTTTTPKPTNPVTPTTPQEGNLVKDTKGNDALKGDGKNTTFVYTGGSDTLTDTGGKDTLVFGNGITFNQVGSGLMQSGNDLVLRVNGSTANQITLKNFFADQSSIIETIKFETGGQIDYKQIYELFGKTVPTDTPAPVTDTTTPATPSVSPQNNFVGTNKADKLTGTDGNDQLQGLAGADTLTGNAGNDILIGGTGNDTLIGGAGNDLYYFAKGFGKDTIVNTGGGYDNIYFEDISFNQVGSGLVKSGNNLILKVKGTTDELTLKDFFLGGDDASLNVHFKDGGSISNTQLLNAFKSTKTPTHTDTQGFNASLEIALGLMEEFKGLNGENGGVI